MNSRQGLGIGVALTLLIAMEGRLTAGASSRREGLAAWHQMYSVLTPPRCINCHTATTYPGRDDRRPHLFNVVRGQQDHGVPAITCAACPLRATSVSHQLTENSETEED